MLKTMLDILQTLSVSLSAVSVTVDLPDNELSTLCMMCSSSNTLASFTHIVP